MADRAGAEEAVHADREESFLLAVPEKRFLRWLAGKLPRWILPDDMTAIGVFAALAVAVADQLSNESLSWLWSPAPCWSCSGSATRLTARLPGCAGSSGPPTATTSTIWSMRSPPRRSGSASG